MRNLQLILFYPLLLLLLILGITVIDNHAQKASCQQYKEMTGKSTTFYEYRGCFVTLHNGNLMRLDDYKKTNSNWKDK